MLSKKMDYSVVLLIVAAALSRLIPHWPNFTPVMAIALFGGAVLSSRTKAILVPLAAMLLSDVVLALVSGGNYMFHDTQIAVYACIVAISLFGTLFAKESRVKTTLVGGTAAGLFFFIVTNFAVWISGGMYPLTLEGLVACYAAGAAFYRDGGSFLLNIMLSTWFYAVLLFAGAASARRLSLHQL